MRLMETFAEGRGVRVDLFDDRFEFHPALNSEILTSGAGELGMAVPRNPARHARRAADVPIAVLLRPWAIATQTFNVHKGIRLCEIEGWVRDNLSLSLSRLRAASVVSIR